MRSIATLVMSLVMALGAIGLAVAAPGAFGGEELARAEVQAASGAVGITNSRDGQAVFSAAAMRPGEGVSGTVTIGNDGDRSGRFAVRAIGLDDVEGPNGGKLSERVELVLFDVTNVQQPVTKYAGDPASFARTDLGNFAPGQARVYLFAATLPDGGADDNLYQGSSLSLGFEWSAVGALGDPAPNPTSPTPTRRRPPRPRRASTTPVTPTPTPAPTTTPTAAGRARRRDRHAVADELRQGAASSRCASRRRREPRSCRRRSRSTGA